ncbi:unnamed protein product, partial [Discosporangium mesarthrocarpum]
MPGKTAAVASRPRRRLTFVPGGRIADLGLPPHSRVHLTIAGACVKSKEDTWSDEDEGRRVYCVAYECPSRCQESAAAEDGEDLCEEEIGSSRPTQGTGLEWRFDVAVQVSVECGLRVELWEHSTLSDDTLLAVASTDSVSSISAEASSTPLTSRATLTLLPPGEGLANAEEEEGWFKSGVVALHYPSAAADLVSREVSSGIGGRALVQKRIGVLHVTVWEARALRTIGKKGAYVLASVGAQVHQMEPKQGRGCWFGETISPEWGEAMEFDVFNITDDLRVQVLEAHNMRKDRVIGQVLVPLSSLLMGLGTAPAQDMWYEILPPVSPMSHNRTGQYRTAMRGTRVGGYGLPRPDQPLGFICFGTELRIAAPAPLLYLTPRGNGRHPRNTLAWKGASGGGGAGAGVVE